MREQLAVAASMLVGILIVASSASGEILAGPDATKVCAGNQGGGIRWSISLNEGWRPSRLIRYRVILRGPDGKIIDERASVKQNGGWFGPYPYWDNGVVSQNPVIGTNSLSALLPGTYSFTLELRVDARYPDLHSVTQRNFDWPRHAGQWVRWPSSKIRVYRCS